MNLCSDPSHKWLDGSQPIKQILKKNIIQQFKNKKKTIQEHIKNLHKVHKNHSQGIPTQQNNHYRYFGSSTIVPCSQAHWQSHLFTILWKATRVCANLISGELLFHRVVAMAEKALPGFRPWLTGSDELGRHNVMSLDWELSTAAMSWSSFISQLFF